MIGRRVAITGLGVVAPCGIGQENFWSGLLGPGITSGKWITIAEWDPLPWFNNNAKEARRADRVEQFAVAALGGGRWNQRDARVRRRCDQKSVSEVD